MSVRLRSVPLWVPWIAPLVLRVLGVGIAPSHGIEKALVANVTQAKESIRQSIKKG